jgi:cytochrome c5
LSSASAFAASKTASQEKQPAAMNVADATSSDAKYCIANNPDEATGSRIYTRECRTKAEWAKRGVDVAEIQQQPR